MCGCRYRARLPDFVGKGSLGQRFVGVRIGGRYRSPDQSQVTNPNCWAVADLQLYETFNA